MDRYLQPNSAYDRLLAEYKQHGGLVVGVDFDGTLHDYHKVGDSHEMVRQLVRDLKANNCKIVIWTAYKDLDYVAEFCDTHSIPFDGINIEGIKLPWESKKPFFSVLLDDRAGLEHVYNDLTKLLNEISSN